MKRIFDFYRERVSQEVFTHEEIDALIISTDLNGDGLLDYEEFLNMFAEKNQKF